MKHAKSIDVTCLGILVLDVLGKTINEFPEEGTSVYFDSMQMMPGGCAYNTGVDAKRLGLHVSIQGRVGNDGFARVILDALEKEDISSAKITRGDTSTAFSFIMVPDSGQRRIYNIPTSNHALRSQDVDLPSIKDSRVLHIAGSSLMPLFDGEPTVELLKFCKENGVITSMDPVFKPGIAPVIVPALPHLDLFLPNTEESVHITGFKKPEDQLSFYLDKGVRIAGIKMGEKGALISDGKERFQVGAYRVAVADTCGAGDAFIAGFIYGLLKEWELRTTATFATATAAFCVQGPGATSGVASAAEILEFTTRIPLTG